VELFKTHGSLLHTQAPELPYCILIFEHRNDLAVTEQDQSVAHRDAQAIVHIKYEV